MDELRCTTFGIALDRDGVFLRVEWVREAALRRQGTLSRPPTVAVAAFIKHLRDTNGGRR